MRGIEFRAGTAVKEPYPKHWHEEYQFCFIDDGDGELTYRGKSHRTPKNSLFVVPPGEVHSNSTETQCSFRSLYVDPGSIRKLTRDSDGNTEEDPFFADPMIFDEEVVADYLAVHHADSSSATNLERESVLLELITKVSDRYAGSSRREEFGYERDAVKIAREYIDSRFNESVSLSDLSTITGLSPFHLNRVFSSTVGMPPHAYQIQRRIAAAKKLIRKGIPLSYVALDTGFADQSHFSRHFKRLMKITPGEY